YLLFDYQGLCGRFDRRGGSVAEARALCGDVRRIAFVGVLVISLVLLYWFTAPGEFSIIDLYLRHARDGALIQPYPIGSTLWLEIGSPERLESARRHFEE